MPRTKKPTTERSQPTTERSHWKWIVPAGVVALVVVGIAVAMWWTGTPPGQLVELVEQGDTRDLDESPEPHPGGDRVLIFALDGVGDDVFRDAIEGDLQRVSELFGARESEELYDHAWVVPGALSILPSTTMAAWTSAFTGEPPARTGVSGNEWFARDEMRFYAPAPVSVRGHADTLRMLNDGLVGNASAVPTLFERVEGRTHVSLLPVYRGADVYNMPAPEALAGLFGALAEGIVGDETVSQDEYRTIDTQSIDAVESTIEDHGLPTLQVVYFPGVDLFTHVTQNPHEEQKRYLGEVVGPAIGRVLDIYRARDALDDTWVVFISDHGHTPVLNDDRHALHVDGEDEPTAILEQEGFRVRGPVLDPALESEDYQAVVAYQGAIAYVYLADRSTCPEEGQRCDWNAAPRWEQDVRPVARAFVEAGRGERAVGGLDGALDAVFTREPRPVGQDAVAFEVFDGERRVPVGEWVRREGRDDLLALEERMRGLSEGPLGHRAGDVLLLTRTGLERPIEERFYFSGPYRSWHGSASATDSEITFAVARSGLDGEAIRRRAREVVGEQVSQLDLVPLVLRMLAADGDD